ncbi:MAG: cytochrome P450 [Novosphingobium sp.]|nr:cytochrome P450 [Novosphingobium sp.]
MVFNSRTVERPSHVPEEAVHEFDYFRDEGLFTDPHQRILDLVDAAPPLFWTPHNGGHWMAVGYNEAFHILREPETFSSALMSAEAAQQAGPTRLPDGRRIPMMTPIMMDPPQHTRLRGPLQKTFSPRTAIALKDDIEGLAIDLVDAVVPLGYADFVTAIAEPLPVRIFLKMMGLPDDRISEFRAMVREVLEPRGFDPVEEVLRMRRIGDAMIDQIIARRTDPQDDIISLLWSVEIDGQPMSLELMEDYCCLLFIAGLDTVINAMTYGIRHLARNPKLQTQLRADPEAIVEATEELLRLYSFTGPVRRVTRETKLADRILQTGDIVFVYLGGVDLDPREFPEPDHFDLDRENKNHLIFGAGPHRCLGSHLARIELQTLYRVVLERLPEFRMDPDQHPVFHPGNILSVSKLPIRWD